MRIAVWFSCGAASAVAAKKTLEKYGKENEVIILNSPVMEEHQDNRRFLKDVEQWLQHPITILIPKKYPSCSAIEVWDKRKFMSSPYGAPCTYELKKRPRQEWEEKNPVDYHVLGFTVDEKKRHERFILTERENVLPILIEEDLRKSDCFQIINKAGLRLPEMYRIGYPNANCIGCVKASSPTYWNHVRKFHPEVFKDRAQQSRKIGAKLATHKGKRLFLDELPETAVGKSLKSINFECGLFCEEYKS